MTTAATVAEAALSACTNRNHTHQGEPPWVHVDDRGNAGDGFAIVDYDGQSVLDLDAAPDMVPDANWGGCYSSPRMRTHGTLA